MGQKVNPVGFRVGFNRDWNSKWFATKKEYAAFLHEDIQIRKYLDAQLEHAMLSHIAISRVKSSSGYTVFIRIYVARVGEVVGVDGSNIQRLSKAVAKLVKSSNAKLEVVEVKNPDLDATLVAKWIASELENRAAFRSTMKKAITRMRKAGAKGCRTVCSGRLAGAEIARSEGYKEGVVPLHTIKADIDFAHIPAKTTYGNIGVKVWICRSLEKNNTNEVNEAPNSNDRPRKERNRGGDNNATTETR